MCTCLYLCPLVLGNAPLCSVIKAGLLQSRCMFVHVCVRHIGWSVGYSCVWFLLHTDYTPAGICLLFKRPSPLFPFLSLLPVSALSPPSQRPLRCRGQRRTPQCSTWPMSPLTAFWRNIPQHWSCSMPLVSKKAKKRKRAGQMIIFIINQLFDLYSVKKWTSKLKAKIMSCLFYPTNNPKLKRD